MTEPSLHVALVEPEIPWNTGNVGRTCLAAGAELHLIKPLGFSLDAWHVRRAGLDYWDQVNPRVWSSWQAFEDALPRLSSAAFFVSPDGVREIWEVDYPPATMLIFGKESRGFSADLRERYQDRLIRVPHSQSEVRSLNLSSCVAVCVFEVLRRRFTTG